jgi:hypothetical protein
MIRTLQAMAVALALAAPIHVAAAPAPAKPKPVDLNDIVLPPESARHNKLGMDAYRAEDYETAYRELKLAYEGLDAHADIDGRDMVLASLRTSLVRLYEKTGELKHLCLARTELLRHLESLLLTYGEDTDLQDVPGIKRRLRQIKGKIAAHPPRMDEPGCDGPVVRLERPSPPPRASSAPPPPPPNLRDRGRPALIIGATSLSFGGLFLGAMTYALLMRRASDDGIKALGAAAAMNADGLHTREQRALADTLAEVGSYHRTVAVATGISGGALVLTGIVALVVRRAARGKTSKNTVQLAPALTGGSLTFTTRF